MASTCAALRWAADAAIPSHSRAEEEVLLMFDGELNVELGDNKITLHKGDTLTLPKGENRAWRSGNAGASVFVVRGTDTPAAPQFA